MSLPGKFEVTDTGSASYTIPIQIVPGAAGLEPKLSLQYDSRGGNGLLGVGWSLSGLPAITRCPKTIAQDGAVGGINYDANDRFCLDGQRLIAISGTYGADQTEYRTERESFSKILSYGTAGNGPAHFKVWTKAGLVMEFGNTADSRIEAQGKSSIRVWAINKTSDTKGNYFAVSYIEDNANGEYRPNRIDYTGNGSTVAPASSLRFSYDTRPDIAPLYDAGSMVRTAQRLTRIQAWQGEVPMREYRLAYRANPQQTSILDSIDACPASGACWPAHSFTYGYANHTFTSGRIFPASIGWNEQRSWYAADVNGDGRSDIVIRLEDGLLVTALSDGSGFQQVSNSLTGVASRSDRSWHLMDVNGDNRSDMVIQLEDGRLVTYLSDGSGFHQNAVFASGVSWRSDRGWYPMDVNGDGRTDMVVQLEDGRLATYLSNGGGFYQSAVFATGIGWRSDRGWYPMDVNGDGRADLVVRLEDGRFAVFLSNGAGFQAGPIFATGVGWRSDRGWYPMDVNGDGRMDMVVRLEDGRLLTYFSDGIGFREGAVSATGIGWRSDRQWLPMDANGDGRTDLIAVLEDGRLVPHFSNGLGFQQGPLSPTGIGWRVDRSWLPMDVDGNGRADLVVQREDGHLFPYLSPPSTDNLLTRIANGSSSTTQIGYKAMSEVGSDYWKEQDAVYPQVDISGPLYIVSRVTSSNGVGGEYTSTYQYIGAKADSQGRGFLGFRQMAVRDEQTQIEQVGTYRQDYPFVGLLKRRDKRWKLPSGAYLTLNRSTNIYDATNLGGTRRLPFLTQSLEESWELNGTALPAVTTSYQYDGFGNATQVSVSTGDGHSKVTTNSYQNDAATWLLGRLTRSEVISTTPGQ